MKDLTISNLQSILSKTDEIKRSGTGEIPASPFSEYVKQSLNEVNQKMLEADQAIDDLATGKNPDIHGTMISMQKADVSFELVLQIRNKIVAAYDEIRKMAI